MILTPYDIALYILQHGNNLHLRRISNAYKNSEPPFSTNEITKLSTFGDDVHVHLRSAISWGLITNTKDEQGKKISSRFFTANTEYLKHHIITIPVGRKVELAFLASGYYISHRKITSSGSIYYTIVDDKGDEYVVRLATHVLKCRKNRTNFYVKPALFINMYVPKTQIFGLSRLQQYFLIDSKHIDEIREAYLTLATSLNPDTLVSALI